MSTETHETATGASAVVQRGEYGRKVIEQCHIIYPLHEEGPCQGNCKIVPADFRLAAERIVGLEEDIVKLHDELRLVREEADGYKADAAYWEGKATDGGS